MDLAKEYREIAELTGGTLDGTVFTHEVGDGCVLSVDIDDPAGLLMVFQDICEGWWWERRVKPSDGSVRYAAGREPNLQNVKIESTGNFHADFCRLLVAVLREINSTTERTKGS